MFKSGRDWQIKPILVDLVSNISIISAIYLTYTNLPLALIFVYNIYCQKTALYFSGQGKVNLDNCFYFFCDLYRVINIEECHWQILSELQIAIACSCWQLSLFCLNSLLITYLKSCWIDTIFSMKYRFLLF